MFGATKIRDFYNTAKSGLSDLFGGGNDFKTIGGNTDVSFGAGAGTDYSTNNQNSFGGNNGMNFGGGQSQNQNFFGDSNNYGGFQQQNQPFGGYGGMQPFGGGYGGMQMPFGGGYGGGYGGMQMPMFGGGYGGMQMPMFGGGYGGGYGGGMRSMYQPQPNYFGGYQQPNPFGNRGMGSIYANYFGNNMGKYQLPYGQNMPQYRQPTPRIAEQSPDRYRTKPVEDVADAEPIPVNPTPKPDRQPSTGSIRYDNGRARFSNEPPIQGTWGVEGKKEYDTWMSQNPDADWREMYDYEDQLRKKYGADKNQYGDRWDTVYFGGGPWGSRKGDSQGNPGGGPAAGSIVNPILSDTTPGRGGQPASVRNTEGFISDQQLDDYFNSQSQEFRDAWDNYKPKAGGAYGGGYGGRNPLWDYENNTLNRREVMRQNLRNERAQNNSNLNRGLHDLF